MSRFFPSTVLITGATGAIGSALAKAYAATGITLILHGRKESRLMVLAANCRDLGARVITFVLDLRDHTALREQLLILAEEIPIDLVIVNAGVNTNNGIDGAGEQWDSIENLLAVNITAAIATVNAVLPSMRRRRHGQIALISSLAAWYGLPAAPSYCASKAALKVYGEAMSSWLAGEGIAVSVVLPGNVESSMCSAMPGPKPFIWTASRAAARIKRGLEKRQRRVSFPFPLNMGAWLLAVVHPRISQWVLALLGYRV